MSNVYIDERLLDAAGLSEFPELYAYIKERYPKPIGELSQPVPIGEQTLQQQVKNNDDVIHTSNEAFAPPVPNAIMKLDLNSQLEQQSFLASSGSDPQLIVYGDRITLTTSYATIGLFSSGVQLGGQLSGYLFKSYPPETRPKAGDQVIALVGTDAPNTQISSNTALVLNIRYYKSQESSKKINYDANNDGKIDIMDTCNQNEKGQFEAQSYVYETVKKQTDLIEAGVQGLNRSNYLNSEIKLMDELALYKANRAAYFIKDRPFIIYSLGQKKVLPRNIKYMPIHVEQQEFSAICLFKDMYDKSSAVQVALSGKLSMFDCEFQGTYIIDNYANASASNEVASEEPESHIDEVIIKHEQKIAYNTFYIVDDGTCRVCVFNLYFESKGLQGRTQEVGRIPDSVLPADGKKPQESIPTDSDDVYKYCASGMYYLRKKSTKSIILTREI
ncbi:MAG: hypothetical protein EZS28_002506 [Streblomastix strix]|uniref:Uncharacterized protein n=1 Tax=Streblomastix strix TaxID=222440 RepID=A0A5J4X579_9EUKA|nr:MAG: hypothetical protein EZS28_002506 [Streblomastix strix]